MRRFQSLGWVFGVAAVAGCGSESDSSAVEVPETYEFESRFDAKQSSVSYSGQTARFAIIEGIGAFLDELTARLDDGTFKAEAGDVRAALLALYEFDGSLRGGDAQPIVTEPAALQKTYDDIATGKQLKDKFAGNGGDVEHRDWKTEFKGVKGQRSAEGLLLGLFDELDALAVARAKGEPAVSAEVPVFVTADGRDLKEMIEKLLLVGIAYTQATDKYLDEELDEATNVREEGDEESLYTPLEHAWDEGFGYFGASRDYGLRSDEEIAEAPAFDTNGDGKIDLLTEMTFGPARYAARRDAGAKEATDFSGEIWNAFVTGRAIIAAAGDELSEDEKADLLAQRDIAVGAYEKVIAANTVHYVNEMLTDLANAGTDAFVFADLAGHFAEAKAFALGLQLNPRSQISTADFDELHAALGDAPVLPEAGKSAVEAYRGKLREARAILGEAYGFAEANLGDDNGQNGW